MVGGTYREKCTEPAFDALRGSGLRASSLLASLGSRVAFRTCVDETSAQEASALFHDLNILSSVEPRPDPVTFRYDTPISPARWQYEAEPLALDVRAGHVVAFGMVDARWRVTADRTVIDPQHGDLFAMVSGTATPPGGLSVVLNAHEARRLTGLPLEDAGRQLLGLGAEVVVIKQGALGGVVFHGDAVEQYGPIPTVTTRTIGSGDAFTSGFAHAWFTNPDDPISAARFGAQVAAAHSMTDVPQVDLGLLASLPEPLSHPHDVPKVYLAAPFFTTSERLLLETVRAGLLDAGVEVFSPLHEVGSGGDEVAIADINGLSECHSVLALLDGADPGTVFETGWATNAHIPVVGFAAHPDAHDWTMLRGTGAHISADLTSAVHLAAWAAIEAAARPVGEGS